jgi:hypothetical protein
MGVIFHSNDCYIHSKYRITHYWGQDCSDFQEPQKHAFYLDESNLWFTITMERIYIKDLKEEIELVMLDF